MKKKVENLGLVRYKERLNALVAQLDRATDYESVGRAFESLQAHQTIQALTLIRRCLFCFVINLLPFCLGLISDMKQSTILWCEFPSMFVCHRYSVNLPRLAASDSKQFGAKIDIADFLGQESKISQVQPEG